MTYVKKGNVIKRVGDKVAESFINAGWKLSNEKEFNSLPKKTIKSTKESE